LAAGIVLLCVGLPGAMPSCRAPREGPAAGRVFGGEPTDPLPPAKANRRCLECHIDFEEELIVVAHQKAGVTCMRCHGYSQAHMEDEVRATKADAAFRGKAMTVFCQTCHEPARHRRVREHAAELAKPLEKRRTCTACHGEHKLLEMQPEKASS